MTSNSIGCKITIVKRSLNKELAAEYLEEEYQGIKPCEIFEDGQEFVFEGYSALESVPEGFCSSAWADIRQDIFSILCGADVPGMKEPGTILSSCTDWYRPVLFKIQRM